MSTVTQLTWEDFLKLPEHAGKQELLNGELIEMPPARVEHNGVVKKIFLWLVGLLGEQRVWAEGGYRLRAGWLVPDVSVTWPDQAMENSWLIGAPMLAIEVASPGNTAVQLDQKVITYFEEGAAEVWVVYRATRSMMAFTDKGATATRVTATWRSPALDVEVDVRALTE